MEHSHAGAAIAVAVADDHPVVRKGLAWLLEESGRYRVEVEAGHGGGLVAALEAESAVRLAIVDLYMPEMDGMATLAWLCAHRPQLRRVVFTARVEERTVLGCYRAGAQAVLQKDAAPGDLLAVLDTVMAGGIHHSPFSQQVLLDNPDGLTPDERRRTRLRAQMTSRQLQVLEALCRSDDPTYETIAAELGVSRRTVESHGSELFEVFGVRSKTALVRSALSLRLVDL